MEYIDRGYETYQRRKLYQFVTIKLVADASSNDFEELGIEDTQTCESYDDNDWDGQLPKLPPEDLDPAPKSGNNYVNTEVMLPRENKVDRGTIFWKKRNVDRNLSGRAIIT